MRVNRRLLYTGVFLLAIGAVLVAADLGVVDTPELADALRLWPLAIAAIGLGLVLRRTQAALAVGLVAALVPGLVLGGGLAVAPRFAGDCARGEVPLAAPVGQGAFDGPASVSITGGCGSLQVRTAAGSGWLLAAGNTEGRLPSVVAAGRSLEIGSDAPDGGGFLDRGRSTWDVTLPTSELERVALVVNAGEGRADLSDARIGRLALTAIASALSVDASTASVRELSGAVNVGRLSVRLPASSDLVGTLHLGGGQLQVCSPPGLGLRVAWRGVASGVEVEGRTQQRGSAWESPNYASATHRADLTVHASFGAVEINPIGGCS